MRIAMIVPGGVDPSGTHRVIPCLLWLLERISRHHEIHVFALRGDADGARYSLCGATIHDVPGAGPRTLPTVRAILGEHGRAPFQLLHAFWASGAGVVAAILRPFIRRPVLLHLPGGDLEALPDIGYGGRVHAVGRLRVRCALAGATARTAPSEAICRHAAALGHPARRLPLGVSPAAWPPRPPRPRQPDVPARLVHVGSLNRVKDQGTLLHAAAHLDRAGVDFTLDMIGGDTLDGEMQRLAVTLGIDGRTRFHGFLTQERLRPIVEAADLMVVSSRHEAGPVAAAEAAMVGVPTVGTAVGMLDEWAPRAAVVVPVGDHRALAEAARGLLEDDDRRRRVAEEAQDRALAEDADWSAHEVLALYDELTA